LISIATALEGVRQGIILVDALVKTIRAGRSKVTEDGLPTGEEYTAERIETLGKQVLSHRDSTATSLISDILAQDRETRARESRG